MEGAPPPPARLTAADLLASPNPLAGHYRRFRVAERLMLTGHSHQAWPDRGFDGQLRAWADAAEHVDDKWEEAFRRAERVRAGYARLLDDARERIALAANTHELVVRFLSALPLRERPRVVTSTGEFHSIRRQLDRLEEEGLEVVRIEARDPDALAGRAASEVDDRTAAVLVSSVLFENARIVPGLEGLAAACRRVGARLLVDAYHHLNAVPFSVPGMGLDDAFVVGGGYKYCQLGEGNAFLRFPDDPGLRPVVTGWFAEFGAVVDAPERDAAAPERELARSRRRVAYAPGPARFSGATYDPTSHYRAAEVFDFFRETGLDPALLREVSRHQIARLAEAFDALDLDPAVIDRDRSAPLERTAGFLALRAPGAGRLVELLREGGVRADHRGGALRLGPAPYLSVEQLDRAVAVLGGVLGEAGG
jgi:kynureninase